MSLGFQRALKKRERKREPVKKNYNYDKIYYDFIYSISDE